MDLYHAIRLSAFKAVKDTPPDYTSRYLRRWYSKTFATPLAEVDDILEEDILQHYFEEKFEEMSEEELEVELEALLETDEEKAIKAKEKDIADAESFDFARFTEEQEAKAKSQKLSEVKSAKPESLLKGAPEATSAIPQIPTVTQNMSLFEEDVHVSFLGEDLGELEAMSKRGNK
jgi:hypothetical protein